MQTAADPGQVILDDLTEIQVERAKLEAKSAAKMLEFADLRRRQSETEPNPTVRDLDGAVPPRRGPPGPRPAADDLAGVLVR
jgi:hypothetical protein